jgi:hypothetical protein
MKRLRFGILAGLLVAAALIPQTALAHNPRCPKGRIKSITSASVTIQNAAGLTWTYNLTPTTAQVSKSGAVVVLAADDLVRLNADGQNNAQVIRKLN